MNRKSKRRNGQMKSLFEVIIGLAQKRKFKKISAEEFIEMKESGKDISIIDCRSKDDYAEGHIEGAINIPYQGFMKKWNSTPKKKTVITICYVGIYGRVAAQRIANSGKHNAYTVIGGMNAIDKLSMKAKN